MPAMAPFGMPLLFTPADFPNSASASDESMSPMTSLFTPRGRPASSRAPVALGGVVEVGVIAGGAALDITVAAVEVRCGGEDGADGADAVAVVDVASPSFKPPPAVLVPVHVPHIALHSSLRPLPFPITTTVRPKSRQAESNVRIHEYNRGGICVYEYIYLTQHVYKKNIYIYIYIVLCIYTYTVECGREV